MLGWVLDLDLAVDSSSRPPLAVGQHWSTVGGKMEVVVTKRYDRNYDLSSTPIFKCYVYDPEDYIIINESSYIYYEADGRSNIHEHRPEWEVKDLISGHVFKSTFPLSILIYRLSSLIEDPKSGHWADLFNTLDMAKVLAHLYTLRLFFPRMFPGTNFFSISERLMCNIDFDRAMCAIGYWCEDGSSADIGYVEPSTPMWKIEEIARSINMVRVVNGEFTPGAT